MKEARIKKKETEFLPAARKAKLQPTFKLNKESLQNLLKSCIYLLRDPPNRRQAMAFLMSMLPKIEGATLFATVS